MTYTTANLLVSRATFNEIHGKLTAAGYGHAVNPMRVDMRGISLVPDDEYLSAEDSKKFLDGLALIRATTAY